MFLLIPTHSSKTVGLVTLNELKQQQQMVVEERERQERLISEFDDFMEPTTG